MTGWKTWAGAVIMGIGAALTALGYDELAKAFEAFGFAVISIGIGHKIEKATNGK
jgi:hypothetical protein